MNRDLGKGNMVLGFLWLFRFLEQDSPAGPNLA